MLQGTEQASGSRPHHHQAAVAGRWNNVLYWGRDGYCEDVLQGTSWLYMQSMCLRKRNKKHEHQQEQKLLLGEHISCTKVVLNQQPKIFVNQGVTFTDTSSIISSPLVAWDSRCSKYSTLPWRDDLSWASTPGGGRRSPLTPTGNPSWAVRAPPGPSHWAKAVSWTSSRTGFAHNLSLFHRKILAMSELGQLTKQIDKSKDQNEDAVS